MFFYAQNSRILHIQDPCMYNKINKIRWNVVFILLDEDGFPMDEI
jgi:hypothetical protein